MLEQRETVSREICPNDSMVLVLSSDPNLVGCLECSHCGFVLIRSKYALGEAGPDVN